MPMNGRMMYPDEQSPVGLDRGDTTSEVYQSAAGDMEKDTGEDKVSAKAGPPDVAQLVQAVQALLDAIKGGSDTGAAMPEDEMEPQEEANPLLAEPLEGEMGDMPDLPPVPVRKRMGF